MSFTGIFSLKEYCLISSTDGLSENRFKNMSAQLRSKSVTFPKEVGDR